MRIIREIETDYKINNPQDIEKYLKEFKNEDREYFIILGLNTINNPVYREIVHIGTLNSCLIHPREVFKKAILMSVNSIICVHNHPSGSTEPSIEDIQIRDRLNKAGDILRIKILDHLILTNKGINSFKEV